MTEENLMAELMNRPDDELNFNQWLQKQWLKFYNSHGGTVSRNDFARYLGISNQSLTNYTTNLRTPDVKSAEILADKLGPIVYDKLGLPRRMPKDRGLYLVVDTWHDFSEQERAEMVARARERAEKRKAKGGSSHGENAFA